MTQCPSVLRTKDPGSQGPRSPVFVFVCPPDVTKWPQRVRFESIFPRDFSTDVFFSNFSVCRDVFSPCLSPCFFRVGFFESISLLLVSFLVTLFLCAPSWALAAVVTRLSFSHVVLCWSALLSSVSVCLFLTLIVSVCLCLSIRSHHKHPSARDNFGPLVTQIDNRNREAK